MQLAAEDVLIAIEVSLIENLSTVTIVVLLTILKTKSKKSYHMLAIQKYT